VYPSIETGGAYFAFCLQPGGVREPVEEAEYTVNWWSG